MDHGKEITYVIYLKKNLAYRQKFYKDKSNCYFTGKYLGATRCICNLRYLVLGEIPVFLHDVSNYNFHLLVKYLSEKFKEY